MNFGINTLLFEAPFTMQSVHWLPIFKNWGFDSVELAVMGPSDFDPAAMKSELDKNGLICGSLCGIWGLDRDLRGTPEAQKASLDYSRKMIDYCVVLGCPTLMGPIYSAVGRSEPVPEKEKKRQWKTVVSNLRKIANYAEKHEVDIAMEPLNRFESDFINTCDQAIQMIEDVGSPALKVQLDTFHMNIEEKSSPDAIRKAGSLLGHFHACGSDRGTPGGDHIDWKGIAKALKEVGYDKSIVIESFTPNIEAIAAATKIWRAIEPSRDSIAIDGLKFLKKTIKKP